MKQSSNLGLALYDKTDLMNITGLENSLNHNMELIDLNISQLSTNKAPAGFGLGTTAKKITDWNNANIGEWCTSDAGAANSPDKNYGWFGFVYASGNPEVFIQDAFALTNVNKYYHRRRLYYPGDGAGTPWEWPDPPFDENVVYRTTERHLGNPVYKKMDTYGVIWWSTDQENWKVEATRLGAMKSILTGGFLDGIPNLNDLNNRITGPGWFRILRTKANESFLIRLSHGYTSGGPEDMLFHVCIDNDCPSIVILSNSVRGQDRLFYTKIRVTRDSTYHYVDFYYDKNDPNSVQSSIWWFNKYKSGRMTEPLLLSQVDDAPSGETILLTQNVSIIDSGNVLTVGSDNILPINKGGTGVQSITALRKTVGIGTSVSCRAGSSVNITLPDNGSYLICANDNVRYGVILVQARSNYGSVGKVTVLSTLRNWSYAIGDNVLTLSETDGEWDVSFFITSLGMYTYGS